MAAKYHSPQSISDGTPLTITLRSESAEEKRELLDLFMKRGSLNLRVIQSENEEWATKNFGPRVPILSLLGIVEEVGELSHSHLKRDQGIRGTKEEHDAAGKDSVGDIVIYLMDYCNGMGWDLESIIRETWDEVKKRDWKKNKTDGNVPNKPVKKYILNPNPEHGPLETGQGNHPQYHDSIDLRQRIDGLDR